MTATITPRVTRHPVPDADGLIFRDGYGPVHEVARIGDGGITGRVWRNVHRDDDGIHIEFDVTIDGIGGASDDGLGSEPHRLRELAAVAQATADELEEARALQRHPAGRSRRTA